MFSITLMALLVYAQRTHMIPDVPDPTGRTIIAEAGMSAEVLAAAGCNVNDAGNIVAAVLNNSNGRAARAQAQSNLYAILGQIRDADARLSTNPRDEAAFRDKLALTLSKRTAVQALADAEHALRTQSVTGLAPETAARVEAGVQGRGHAVATPIRVSVPADSNWKLLAIAARAQRRATRMGTPLPARFQSTAQALNANTNITTAGERMSTNIAAIRTALAAAVPPPPGPR